MKLSKMIVVNWGALRSGEYPMGNMTLLTGPTGSGKSTLLDALQTVMTAVYQNIFSYNPGQDETNQNARNGKSKRTLWSYIVGAEDNLFARPHGAHGYIAAVFEPDEGEDGKPFTALVGAAARVDGAKERRQAVQEKLALLIVDDAAVGLGDLLGADLEGGMRVVEVDKIEGRLKVRYGSVINFRDSKREYLCQLYGRFRGQRSVSFAEAELAARAWCQAIAHKPIGSVDDLVKHQILDHDAQQLLSRIGQISDLMRQVQTLRVEGERLRANVSRLERIEASAREATQAHEQAQLLQLAQSTSQLWNDERVLAESGEETSRLHDAITADEGQIATLSEQKKAKTDSLIRLAARLSGMPAAEQKQRLEEKLNASRTGAQQAIAALVAAIGQAEQLQRVADNVTAMRFPADYRQLTQAAQEVEASGAGCDPLLLAVQKDKLGKLAAGDKFDVRAALSAVRALSGLDGTFAATHLALTGTQDSFVAAIHAQMGQMEQDLRRACEQERTLAERKANLSTGGADYPGHVTQALKLFKAALPQARVQVLCDLVEPRNEGWQAAIEGYMGHARFNLVVDPDYEAEAVEFVQRQRLRANVIQGRLCLKRARPDLVSPDSILHELHTDHPIARAYLVDLYGSVVKVHSLEELRSTSRGVMQDGKAAGSRTMYSSSVDTLVFGKEAQRLARDKVVAQHAEAEAGLETLKARQNELKALLGMVGTLPCPTFQAVAELEQAANAIGAVQADLERLDLSEVGQLEAEKQALDAELTALDARITLLNRQIGNHKSAIEASQHAEARVKAGVEAKKHKVLADTEQLKRLCEVNGALSLSALQQQAQDLADGQDAASQFGERIQKQLNIALQAEGDVREQVVEYNQHAKSDEVLSLVHGEQRDGSFAHAYGALVRLAERVREQLGMQREIGLVRNLDELRLAEASFKDVFTKQFCYEIRNAVDGGVKTLKALNLELAKLKFGTDRFTIDWGWEPEYKRYYDFFTAAYELSETQESGDLFNAEELSADNRAVRDELVGLLLSNDQDRAMRELQRVADYRNYRRYEIWKDSDSGARVALSEWGTGSGGQLETPAYIVRAAVVTNRLKHFERGMNLKLLVNDESFAKMDERRAHDVIRFMRDGLGMQLICAMPTMKAGAIKSEFTKEWCFTRTAAEGNGEVDFISEADERDLYPDKLRTLWEARRHEVREQARLVFEAEEEGNPV